MSSKKFRAIRLFVLRWHRRIGVAVSFIIIWISISGILLNHIHSWGIADKLINNRWLASQYAHFDAQYFPIDTQRWLVQQPDGTILFDQVELGVCDTPLVGLTQQQGIFAIACEDLLYLTLADGRLLEHISPEQGLPDNITAIGVSAEQFVLQANSGKHYLFDERSLRFSSVNHTVAVTAATFPPQAIIDAYTAKISPRSVSIERLLLDMHTGAFWGKSQRWFSDIAAILLILIVVGGVWVWLTKPSNR